MSRELNYHMKSHYSQTQIDILWCDFSLNYHMKSHYSQTNRDLLLALV